MMVLLAIAPSVVLCTCLTALLVVRVSPHMGVGSHLILEPYLTIVTKGKLFFVLTRAKGIPLQGCRRMKVVQEVVLA